MYAYGRNKPGLDIYHRSSDRHINYRLMGTFVMFFLVLYLVDHTAAVSKWTCIRRLRCRTHEMQPFLAVGRKLQSAGHRVRLATHASLRCNLVPYLEVNTQKSGCQDRCTGVGVPLRVGFQDALAVGVMANRVH